MRRVLGYVRSQWCALRRPAQVDADMDDEMRFHIEMDARRRIEQGVDADTARRQAAMAFGGIEKYRGASRDALGFSWARGLSVDLALGMRMLSKYPGLTVVAVFALALAIGADAAYLEFTNDLMHGELPFERADRIVGIQQWDQQSGDPEFRNTADFVAWRGTLRSFEDLAAYRTLERNLIADDGRAEPVRGVQISASAFRIARVPPRLGRPLVPDDERPGALPVAVIGSDLWAARFASDPSVVGKTIRLGRDSFTVVGVMPEGFGLPVSHSLWLPLPLNDAFYPPRQGLSIRIFGRLADGVDISAAQAELNAVAARTAAAFPATHEHIRPIVKPYVESIWSAIEDSRIQTIVFYSANVLFIGLLALCGANIATLVFARTVTRETEISVRTALGASRARIAGQLFAEALVLSSIAAAIGLIAAHYALKWVEYKVTLAQGRPMMFWWNDRLSVATVVYACVLAAAAAVIVGVIPALKATGSNVQERLKHATGASSSRLKFGGVWTGVIVTQVAVTVIFLAIVGLLGWTAYASNGRERQRRFATTEYLSVRLTLESLGTNALDTEEQREADYRARFRTTFGELERRLKAESSVAGLTYATRLPGMNHPEMRIEIDGAAARAPDEAAPVVRTALTGENFFETFKAPIVAGRSFTQSDVAAGRNVVIVDQTFVRRVLNGQDAVGRYVREAAGEGRPAGPWLEIVGVATDFTDDTGKTSRDAVIYRPATAESMAPMYLALHANGNPSTVAARLSLVATEVDPTLRLGNVLTMDNVGESDPVALDFFARLLAGVSLVALVLATAGVYALMSFTVSRRTSQIGICLALGATPGRIVMSTFARVLTQVGIGLAAGSVLAGVLVAALGPEVSASAGTGVAIGTCLAATLTVAVVTVVACAIPVRSALRIQPTDALKTT